MSKCFFLFLLLPVYSLTAQPLLRVDRSSAINRDLPVRNVFVDEEGNKWVSNREGVFRLHGTNLATPVALAAGEQSLLYFPGGNYDLKWPADKLLAATGQIFDQENFITAAAYDHKHKELWIGTSQRGLFQLAAGPELKLIQNHSTRNSKLKSDYINTIVITPSGSIWVGTRDGVLVGEEGRWKLLERYFDFRAIAVSGSQVWLMTTDMVGQMEKDGWLPIDIPERKTEGELRDIVFDWEGRLWIASEVVTCYDATKDNFTVYGPAQEFTSQFAERLAVDMDGAILVGTRDKGLFVLEEGSALAVAVTVEKELSCQGQGNDAAVRVRAAGGQPPYSYAWAPALQGDNPRNLSPGVYQVTVTDSKGQTQSARVEVPDTRMTLSVGQDRQESAAGAGDGGATVQVKGGKADYTYRWDNGEAAAKAVRLSEGKHTVTVTDKAGCSSVASVEIVRQLAALAVTIRQTGQIKCNGGEEGGLRAEVSGGKGPYQYRWSNPAFSGPELTSLSAGTYQLTVSDAAGNSQTSGLIIAQPDPLTASATAVAPASTGKADGQATAKASGGTAPYTYRWDNGENAVTAKALAPGTRSVTITDAAGCTATAPVEITENILPLAVSISQTGQIRCNGGKDGALQVEVSGGKGPYQYQWSDPAITGAGPAGLAAGTYRVTVTDAGGGNRSAELSIAQPEALTATVTPVAPAGTDKSDGQATVKAGGGTGAYIYKWDNGEAGTAAKALAPGKRTVTVTDAAGCTATASVDITENILPLTVRIRQTGQIRCNGGKDGALSVELSGGKGPFRYQWSGGSLSGAEASGLAAGTYGLTVTDATGNTRNAELTISQPDALMVSIANVMPASTDKADAQASAKAAGGAGTYTYKWDNGETLPAAKALAPGKRSVTVTDANGCTAAASADITENILPLAVSLSQTSQVKCFGGRDAGLRIQLTGGKGPFRYQWSDAAISGDQPGGLGAGSYQVTVTDASGQSRSAAIDVKSPDSLSAAIVFRKPASFETTKDGKARVQASGGSGAYSYKWDNGETRDQADALPTGVHRVTVTDANGCQAAASVETTLRTIPELTAGQLRSGQTIQMQKLQFDADSTKLNNAARPILDELFDFLKENPAVVVEIGGHTNSLPPPEYCDQLSTARAKAVAQYLIEKGIEGSRVYYKGYGKRQPLFSNQTEDGRRRNQRVEIKILRM